MINNETGAPDAGESPVFNPDEWKRAVRAQMAVLSGGLAPDVYVTAWWEWYLKLAQRPEAQQSIIQDGIAKMVDTWSFGVQAALGQPLTPVPGENRFSDPAWAQWPFNVIARGHHDYAQWWKGAWSGVPGVSPHNERMLEFVARNALEVISPANYLLTNPELLEATRRESGQNLLRGFSHWIADVGRTLTGKPASGTDTYIVGRDVAATPGKVVMRNDLVELIQYSPATTSVFAEPVVIFPASIMKYYILDLSPRNSLVKYLVSQGHTVFIVSWKNPEAGDRDLGMDDYLRLGLKAPLDVVARRVPDAKIHAVGYCIGGTFLSIAAAALAAEGDERLGSVTLMAAQQDFSEPGELSLFISPSQIDMLEAMTERAGVLKSEQMGGAFAMLRSRDLLWTPAVNTYLRGNRENPSDLMAWNADGTRLPHRMHSEYLRELYLNNALARGEFVSEGRTVDLAALRLPMFVVGTETDHVAPWKSVYKARSLTRSSDYTFLLTSGGHNAGIISGPVHPRRRHRVRTWLSEGDVLSPDVWLDTTAPVPGSWWPVWQQWLVNHSNPTRVPPPGSGAAVGSVEAPGVDAPGEYVLQK